MPSKVVSGIYPLSHLSISETPLVRASDLQKHESPEGSGEAFKKGVGLEQKEKEVWTGFQTGGASRAKGKRKTFSWPRTLSFRS